MMRRPIAVGDTVAFNMTLDFYQVVKIEDKGELTLHRIDPASQQPEWITCQSWQVNRIAVAHNRA
jgi:hypothetical protein